MATQATPINPARINVCALRATRLNADGTVAAGPKNGFVSRKLVSIGAAVEADDAAKQSLPDGCGGDVATWSTDPKFQGWTLTIAKGLLEPALEEMMFGGAVILDDSSSPVPIGLQWPSAGDAPPAVAVEAWSKLVIADHSPGEADTGVAGRTYPYVRFLWPYVQFRPADITLELDFGQGGMVGTTKGNTNWGLGPWGDQPVSSNSQGFYVFDDVLPEATSTYVTAAS